MASMCVWRSSGMELNLISDFCGGSPLFILQQRSSRKKCGSRLQCRAQCSIDQGERSVMKAFQKYAVCIAMAAAVALPAMPVAPDAYALEGNRAISDIAILISGPPVRDPSALLRYALPIENKPIRQIQKSLEDITEALKRGPRGITSVPKYVKDAATVLSQNKNKILADIAEPKKSHAEELLASLSTGLDDLKILGDKGSIALKQQELLDIVGNVEEDMVGEFPYKIPEEYASRPWLKGRAAVEMKLNVKDNPNLQDVVFRMVLDGYNAPVTAGNFVDLVERHFYDGMEIQRADGFVVQTGDPDGPSPGFVDPNTGKVRTIPLEIMIDGEKQPEYGATLEDLGLYKARTKLPFNAFGTLAMARDEYENDSASSQIFWLLKESELTPSNANILDGRYAVFGYVVENQDVLADVKVGDTIEYMKVTSGIENLMNPSYKAL